MNKYFMTSVFLSRVEQLDILHIGVRLRALVLFAIGFSLLACGGSSKLPQKAEGDMLGAKALKKQLLNPEFPASILGYTGRVRLNSPDLNVSGTVKVYLENENVCWIRLSKFGFEVGRFRITPDSIHGVNKLQQTFIRAGIQETKEFLGTELSFRDIQHLVWGVPIRVNKKDDIVKIDSLVEVRSAPQKEVKYSYRIRPPFDMVSADWLQKGSGNAGQQELQVKQSDFHKITDNKNFSYLRKYSFRSPVDKLAIELNISKVALDEPQSTDITIPSDYTPY